MSSENLRIIDFTQQEPLPLPRSPIISSNQAGWEKLQLALHHQPAYCIPEHRSPDSEGDKVVYRTTLRGTHTGEFLGIPPTGKSAKINDFTLLRIANNKIVEWWYECNLLEVMKQLGLISA